MALTGDFARLRQLVDSVQEVSRGTLRRATRAAEPVVEAEYRSSFAEQVGPWGEPWRPTAAGKYPALRVTGALEGALVQATTGRVRIRPPRYWVFHQVGANNMARRAVLPFAPSRWDAPIIRAIEDAVLEPLQ